MLRTAQRTTSRCDEDHWQLLDALPRLPSHRLHQLASHLHVSSEPDLPRQYNGRRAEQPRRRNNMTIPSSDTSTGVWSGPTLLSFRAAACTNAARSATSDGLAPRSVRSGTSARYPQISSRRSSLETNLALEANFSTNWEMLQWRPQPS